VTDSHGQVISRLATILAGLQDVDPLAHRLCEAGRQMLDADGAALILPADDELRVTVCATDDLSAELEDAQVVVGQGPTTEALETSTVTRVDVGRGEGARWPLFDERVTVMGFTGVLTVVPLSFEHHTVGVLSARDQEVHETDPSLHRFLGAALAAALLEDPLATLAGSNGDGAWSAQAKVHQATGMLIAQLGVRTTDALALLRAQAFSTGATLLEISESVIDRHINFRDFTVEGD